MWGGRGRGWLYLSVALRMIINYRYVLEKGLGGTASLGIRTGEKNLFALQEVSPLSFRSYGPKFRDVEL